MEIRKVHLTDGIISLSEYIHSLDDFDCYNCWKDDETQNGFNYECIDTFEEFSNQPVKHRFIATVIRNSDNRSIGSIFLSPQNTPPDLAIMIYKPYRKNGFGMRAFELGVKYCFEVLKLKYVYAGCYPHNIASLKMLKYCGFEPHQQNNQNEKHYLTGDDITQLDFIKYNIKR